MQQRFQLRGSFEVSRVAEKENVGCEERRRYQATAKIAQIWRQQNNGRDAERDETHDGKARQNSSASAFVEVDEREFIRPKLRRDQGTYQKSGYDEKYVNTDETARKAGNVGMKQHYRQNSDRSQSIDF